MNSIILEATLAATVLAALPLLYAGLGELLSEKVGVGNYGIEGVMLMGALGGYATAIQTGSPSLGLVGGALTGALFAYLLFVVPTALWRANPVLVSFAVWFIGIGLSSEFGTKYTTQPLDHRLEPLEIPVLERLPVVGPALFDQVYPVYIGFGLVVAVWFMLERTRHGIAVRSLGEDPSAAYANGVNVRRLRMTYMTLGAAFVGLGGAILSIVVTQAWQSGMTGGRGWIAFTLVILAAWRPLAMAGASLLIGLLLSLADLGQAQGWNIPSEVLSSAPYIFAIVALVLQSLIVHRRGGGASAPKALGQDFHVGSR